LEDECLHLLSAHAEYGCDLGVGVAPELEQNQCGSLIGWEALHVVEHLAEVLPPVDRVRGVVVPPIEDRVVDTDRLLARAQLGQAPVPRNLVQPRAQRNVAVAGPQRPVSRNKRELQRILGFLAISQHVHAESEYARGVAIVDRLERGVVAGPHPCHQLIVAAAGTGMTVKRAHPRERPHIAQYP